METKKTVFVYLDNNIIIDLENNQYTKEQLERELLKDRIGSEFQYVYSQAHLYETNTIKAYNHYTKSELEDHRLKLLSELTNGLYFHEGKDNNLVSKLQSPFESYNEIKDFPNESMINLGFEDKMPIKFRKLFRDLLKTNSKEMNNLNGKELIEYLTIKFQSADSNSNFIETYFNVSTEEIIKLKSGKTSLNDKIAEIFGFLDSFGYWKDGETNKSDFARMWDSNHAYYASYCDFFISNDRNTRKKTEFVYWILNIQTKILDFKP